MLWPTKCVMTAGSPGSTPRREGSTPGGTPRLGSGGLGAAAGAEAAGARSVLPIPVSLPVAQMGATAGPTWLHCWQQCFARDRMHLGCQQFTISSSPQQHASIAACCGLWQSRQPIE